MNGDTRSRAGCFRWWLRNRIVSQNGSLTPFPYFLHFFRKKVAGLNPWRLLSVLSGSGCARTSTLIYAAQLPRKIHLGQAILPFLWALFRKFGNPFQGYTSVPLCVHKCVSCFQSLPAHHINSIALSSDLLSFGSFSTSAGNADDNNARNNRIATWIILMDNINPSGSEGDEANNLVEVR